MGFDNECILNIQSLAGEYFCPVCRLLVYPNEALQSQCTHLYCKPCLTYVVGTTRACPYDGYLVTEADSKPLVESNKALAETIGKIAVHCLYHRSGCQWQGPLSECTSHCSGCAFGNSPVVCNRCGTQIVHRQVQEHAQNCPGVQPQASQVEGVQDATATATATVSASSINAEQTQTANQSGLSTSQAKTSQTVTAPPTGQVSNQQANANSQAQAVAPAAVPTPEQWYQQQYQQYYHQFPGYDPYQQPYQNYYQQQAIQQYQQHPQHVQGQHQPQVYTQSQPHPQSQPPVQPQPQPQIQPPLIQPHVQPQPQHVPVAVQGSVNPPHQLNPTVQPHAQMQSQAHPLMHGQPQPQSYSQGLPHAQPNPVQPHQQQHTQMPLYQQPQSQPQPQIQPHPPPPPQIQPQPQPQHPLPQLQPQPHLQSQPQAQLQPPPHPRPQLQPPPQANQPPNPGAQSQAQHLPAHAVTGHQAYPQPQAHQQMQLGAQQPPHLHPQVGPLPHPPVQMHGQFPQQPPQMRPPQSHAPMPNQQQPVMLPSQGQVPSIPPAQQPVHLHSHQPGLSGPPRPVMQQPLQQPVPQQYLQHQQSFPVQTSGPVQNQLYPYGHYAQQQPMQSQVRPQGPLHSVQQNSQAYMSSQQNAALSHGLPPHQPQNYGARPMMPSHGAHPQSFPNSSAGFASASQVRPTMPGANQALTNQNYPQRTNNQLPLSSEQQTVQSGLTSKSMVHERQVDHIPEKSDDKKDGSPSQKSAQKEPNDLVSISGIGVDSVQGKNLNPDTDLNSIDAVEKAVGGEEDENSQVDVQGRDTDSELHAEGNASADPAVKQVVKKEGHESWLESSPGGISIENVAVEHKGASVVLQQGEQSIAGDTSLEQAEPLKEQGGKLPKDEIDGSQAIPLAAAYISESTAQSQIPRTGRDGLQLGSQQRNLSQSQPTTEGPGVDEFRSFSHGQVLGKGFAHPAQPFQPTDQSRHQHIPMHYGPSAHQQFPSGAAVVQSALPPGPSYHAQVPGQPTNMLRPQGPGHLPMPGPPLNPPDHFQQPHGSFHPEIASGGVPGPSSASFGRGPSNFGPPERTFDPQSVTPQGHPMPPLQSGLPRISQGEPLGSSNSFGGIMGRVPPHGPEGKIGQQNSINPMESEVFLDTRSRHLDGRRPDSYLLGSSERAPYGHTPSTESNVMRMNGPPVNESLAPGLRDERFKCLPEEGLNHFPMEPASHINRVSRPLDKAPLGFNYDAGLKLEPGAGGAPGFLPPHHPGGYKDTGDRARLAGPDGNFGRADSAHIRPDFLGPIPGFGRHHMDRLTPRSPGREYQGFPTHDFGGLPRNQSGLDDIDGRESRPFGKGPRSFNFPPDRVGSSFHESRFPRLSGHLPRGELDGPGDLRGSDLIGQDIIPSHLRGEFLGPRNLPGHLLYSEPACFGGFPGHGRMEERAGPGNFLHHLPLGEPFGGNKSVHPRLGEPGFRSSYSLTGGTDPFDNSRKRKPASMGMCRICKVDCESVEGLELHSQTREHQKMAMDMVISIKQQNAKKLKTSNNHSTLEEPSKSRSTGYDVRANKP